MTDVLEGFKAAQRAGWTHFAPLAIQTTVPAAQLVRYAGIRSGQHVLDVGCGTGVVAVTAARLGATVTGLDLTPELLSVARENARTAEVSVDFHEGDAEALPFDASAFDAVVSQFGHIFAPRPDVTIGEMLRVLKPGGVIAFATWPPEIFIGRVFGLTARYMPPPPPGVSPPPQWGDPTIVRERLGDRVRDLRFDRRDMMMPALSPRHVREIFEKTAGPVIKLVEMLSAADPVKLSAYRSELEGLVAEYFDENMIRQGYLLTRAVKL